MPIKGKFFPTQISGERVFLLIRRHWVVFAAMSLVFIALVVPIIILIIYWLSSPDTFSGVLGNFLIIFAGIYSLAVIGLMLYGFVNYYLDVYIVTNKRIVDIKQNGFFRREIAELHLHQVQDVEAKVEGFFQTLLHYGTIYIQTAGERENFVFEDVPHPYTLAKEIVELHEAQIESEYEPQIHGGKLKVDDYRPEDYEVSGSNIEQTEETKFKQIQSQDAEIEDSGGAMKELEESYSPDNFREVSNLATNKEVTPTDSQSPEVELGFGAKISNPGANKTDGELSEGEEINLDDQNHGV